ncbi:MAG: hypothetical protein DMG29_03255 [Acidobacteria bacterium]|nr:MAG: hypothetical protein DMG29_03255 [Acidobacteriota bacterium]
MAPRDLGLAAPMIPDLRDVIPRSSLDFARDRLRRRGICCLFDFAKKQIPRGVYPAPGGAQNDNQKHFFSELLS